MTGSRTVVFAPLRLEARAARRGGPAVEVVRTGGGPARSARAAADVAATGRPDAVVVAGVAGGLRPGLEPGTIVVADRVVDADGNLVTLIDSAPITAAHLQSMGLPAVVGGVISTARVVRGRRARAALAAKGAIAVDTETAWILAARWPVPTLVLRVVVDTPDRELIAPTTVAGGARALRNLRAAAPAIHDWSRSLASRDILLAGPRSFCAGVERAIATVERALDQFGQPVYVRRQIVHNRHVVKDLSARGAVFVDELESVPEGATVVLSAHGVSPAVRAEAAGRDLRVIDATCPLVQKVHHEVRRFTQHGYRVVMVGHPGHDETEGTRGEAEDLILVETREDVARMEVDEGDRLAYITQTTLSPDDVAPIVEELSARFPGIASPHAADICYATQNRQDALAAIARECDLVLVVGSENSSNAARLVEVAERAGTPARLVDDESALTFDLLHGVSTLGITAAASTPPQLVDRVASAVAALGRAVIHERPTRTENVNFPLPLEVR